jgi:hypothetical protein
VRENRTPGSVRGRLGNWPSYRDEQGGMLPRHVCWLTQQAAEKLLKDVSSATWFLLDSAVFCIILSFRTLVPINHCMGGVK